MSQSIPSFLLRCPRLLNQSGYSVSQPRHRLGYKYIRLHHRGVDAHPLCPLQVGPCDPQQEPLYAQGF